MISSAASLQNNQILSLLVNALLPWDIFFAYLLDGFKQKLNQRLPAWLNVWYQAEGLTALANFAYLNPEYRFPVIRDSITQPVLTAKGLGHPLIAKSARVVNDFSFSDLGEVALISGSNMSGKSTFLRTLGVNLTLAYAGTVVNADQMQISILRLFTCIQISDSLKDGFSYFYAEVRRLKKLLTWLEESEQTAVFYLIDEIFQGTNHEERRIGSLAYLKSLVNANGVGAISTHDIELSKMADIELRIQNYNFQDSVEDGKMSFDYRLRPGPSPTTNALKIMAIEGLPVEEGSS
jgi:DNA mismatch repair ATPase MutS